MDWNGNLRMPFVSRPETSFGFLYNYNYDPFQGFDHTKQPFMPSSAQPTMVSPTPTLTDHKNINNNNGMNIVYGQDPKKKRLTNEQLESLEGSFQEEIKLDPDRKMKLAKDLGLQPRQIAVWFQNRRARWKGKQLERLYDALKQEYDAISREKHKLEQEVLGLRAILKDQVGKKQASANYTEVSGEETVESTSIPSSEKPPRGTHNANEIGDCSYVLNVVEDYNGPVIMTPYTWATLP